MSGTLSELLRLPEEIRQAIIVHAANCAPDECCGLLASDDEGRISFAYPLTNANPSPVTYTIDPDEHFHALRHAESLGLEISAVFHSHPSGPATPSMVDVFGALDPDWVHVIVAPEDLRGFRISDGLVVEVELG